METFRVRALSALTKSITKSIVVKPKLIRLHINVVWKILRYSTTKLI